jgi:outer membrane protein assembly factor BamB
MRNALVAVLLPIALAVWSPRCPAENWPRWRGPNGNAVSDEAPLPVQWTTTRNVRWKATVPGEGFSSPLVWDDRVFLTSALDHGGRRLVHCLDRATGKILWTRELPDKNPERTSAMTGHAASTPVTDGRRVVAFFGNAGAICYDRDGGRLWLHDLGEFDTELGLAGSPVLVRDRVILVCDHDGDRFTSFDSFLVALDLQTGKECWRAERLGLGRSWSTPVLVPGPGDRQELVVSGQEQVRGYDPETGKELWRAGGLTAWVAPSPVFGHGLVFAASGKSGPLLAVRPGGSGDVTKTRLAWQHAGAGPYVCSPVLYGDYLYVHDERGALACYDARTGERQYRERLDGKFTASAVAGDGKLYLTNEDGTTFVVRAGPKFAVLATNNLNEYTLASPAVSGKELFLRTEHHLYCIGAAADP